MSSTTSRALVHRPEAWDGPQGVSLDGVKKAIPAHCFEKSGARSLMWLARDLLVWGISLAIFKPLIVALLAESESPWALAALGVATIVHSVIAGTAMWAVFVCGHDAGHGSFSTSWLLNGVSGLVAHSALLVPFYPWALTHRRHHLKHNHVNDDYSFPWWVDSSKHHSVFVQPAFRALSPFIGWFLYLNGFNDGNHYVPLGYQRMWANTPWQEAAKGVLSTVCCVAAAVGIWSVICSGSLALFVLLYGAPWVLFSCWLVTVTYLQHHHETSRVYNDDTWRFVDSAFETVDRTYGLGLDAFTHHITDCHVVHHLCFTDIPHYHLEDASAALKSYLAAQNKMHLYRSVPTPDFFLRVFRYLFSFGFWATLVVKPNDPLLAEKKTE